MIYERLFYVSSIDKPISNVGLLLFWPLLFSDTYVVRIRIPSARIYIQFWNPISVSDFRIQYR